MPQFYNPNVRAAAQQARQGARAQGQRGAAVRQAGTQAGLQARSQLPRFQQQTPQPPQQPPPQQGGQGGYYQYSPTAESQINQPYQDLNAAAAYGSLGNFLGNQPNQQNMANMYGQTAAGSLGNYGALMQPNQQIQQGYANEIQGIQNGNLDVDPALVQMYGQQQRDLNSQLQRQLGPDAATSSAGIEAQGRFQQGMNTGLASANYNRLLGLTNMQQQGMQNIGNMGGAMGGMYGGALNDMYNQSMGLRSNQLNGANAMLGQLGQIQGLYGNIPSTMAQFGQQMSGMAGNAVGAQQPYQNDRFGQFQASQFPTSGQMWGQGLQNSGNRWASIGSGGGGGGGGGGGVPTNPYGSSVSSTDIGGRNIYESSPGSGMMGY